MVPGIALSTILLIPDYRGSYLANHTAFACNYPEPMAILSMFMTMKPRTFLRLILSFCVTACAAQAKGAFSPLEQWRAAIIRGDANSLKALYSNQPPARISVITKGASEVSADSDTAFWTGLKARHMELKISQSQDPQPGVR